MHITTNKYTKVCNCTQVWKWNGDPPHNAYARCGRMEAFFNLSHC